MHHAHAMLCCSLSCCALCCVGAYVTSPTQQLAPLECSPHMLEFADMLPKEEMQKETAEDMTRIILGLSLPAGMPSFAQQVKQKLEAKPSYVDPHFQWRMCEKLPPKKKTKASFKRTKKKRHAASGHIFQTTPHNQHHTRRTH